jgi:hypothetical protein
MTVADRVRSRLASRTRDKPLRPSDVEELGTIDGWRFVKFDDVEYMLDGQALDDSHVATPIGPGEIRVQSPREKVTFGTIETYTETIRGVEVRSGEYERLAARDAKRAQSRASRGALRPVDLSSRVSSVRRDAAGIVAALASEGIAVTLTPAGKLRLDAPNGRCTDEKLLLAERNVRLLTAHLAGTPVACEAHSHPKPVPAVRTLAVDVLSCDEAAS